MSPAPKKSHQPGLAKALRDAQRRHARVLELRQVVDAEVVKRAEAIRLALELGATLRDMAALLEVTPEAVRKMGWVSRSSNTVTPPA